MKATNPNLIFTPILLTIIGFASTNSTFDSSNTQYIPTMNANYTSLDMPENGLENTILTESKSAQEELKDVMLPFFNKILQESKMMDPDIQAYVNEHFGELYD